MLTPQILEGGHSTNPPPQHSTLADEKKSLIGSLLIMYRRVHKNAKKAFKLSEFIC